jgi:hypothetical protein
MKLLDENKKPTKLLSISIGVVASIMLAAVGFRFFGGSLTRADDVAPRDVIVSSITQNSAQITWSTGEDSQGVIEYGTSPTALNFFAPETLRTKQHTADLTLLSPNTTYYFQVRVADKKYDNGGVPWTFTTKSTDSLSTPTKAPTAAAVVQPTASAAEPVTEEPTSPPAASATCSETDCDAIKAKFGKGCSTQDYIKCIKASEQPSE